VRGQRSGLASGTVRWGIDIYLEIGKSRVFAGALEWPGWTRAARDEEAAVQALFEYAARYAKVVDGLGFEAPTAIEHLAVRERLQGDAATDMGSLSGLPPKYDSTPLGEHDHARLIDFLEASWRALDGAVSAGRGKELRKGPRGGGRDLDSIVQHVLDGEGGYLRRLEFKRAREAEKDVRLSRAAMLEALAASVRGEVPELGPRGGKRWSGRYFVRREAWHVLDHAWEIEDRLSE
jgi:hypothetical protein